ncbi:MAG: shikimate dehydrogenase [Cytophagales bacterium]|nr:shikimate dehydrogenase [Bernardetiaceae bacterium]MDW8211761.1 shikimate dehydrogenase [Cytophagales bacterium]
MQRYGLIGRKLSHSFSKKYFTEKFARQCIDATYQLYELESVQALPELIKSQPELKGLNVTIPFKVEVIPLMDYLAPCAAKVGAVNVIKIHSDGRLGGYNSDYDGFKYSLERFIPHGRIFHALILGTGGASKAVQAVLSDMEMEYTFVSRTPADSRTIGYEELKTLGLDAFRLIINTTPLGMYPNIDQFPPLPYEQLTSAHYLHDLVYNPEVTEFMKRGSYYGAHVKNGLEMLYQQAEKAWQIWQSD